MLSPRTNVSSQATKLGLHAVAVLYTGGSIAQLLKLMVDFPWQAMPFIIDWVIVGLGCVGAASLAAQTSHVAYRGVWEKPVHFLIIAHLLVSVALHLWTLVVASHDLYSVFPYSYSYFGLLYFVFFAWRSWTIKLKPASQRS